MGTMEGGRMAHETEAEQMAAMWSRELDQDVRISPSGWVNSPKEYSLWVDGTHVAAYKYLTEVDDYLSRYFVLQPQGVGH